MKQIDIDFFARTDVVQISQELVGKILSTKINGLITKGLITETEAYAGVTDQASHAYGGKRTARTEVMFGEPGISYVYLCYGVHSLFNIVTNQAGVPHAVLIRGVYPIEGIATMIERRGRNTNLRTIANGPGKVCSALGIDYSIHNRVKLNSGSIWVEETSLKIAKEELQIGPRIGVDYAGKDALLPYRFLLKKPEHFVKQL